jgi:hypothetical protein
MLLDYERRFPMPTGDAPEETYGWPAWIYNADDRYAAVVERAEATEALREQEELMEGLTGETLPARRDLTRGGEIFLVLSGLLFIFMTLAALVSNPAGGLAIGGLLFLGWAFLIRAAKEVAASAGGAGNMYRSSILRLNPEWKRQREQRELVVEALLDREDPGELLVHLKSPQYVQLLKDGLARDLAGFTKHD